MNVIRVSIVGMRHHAGALDALRLARSGDVLILRREPTNSYDKNAIQVFLFRGGEQPMQFLGYIAKENTSRIPANCHTARLDFIPERRPIAVIDIDDKKIPSGTAAAQNPT